MGAPGFLGPAGLGLGLMTFVAPDLGLGLGLAFGARGLGLERVVASSIATDLDAMLGGRSCTLRFIK
jgi:hypothetical protein